MLLSVWTGLCTGSLSVVDILVKHTSHCSLYDWSFFNVWGLNIVATSMFSLCVRTKNETISRIMCILLWEITLRRHELYLMLRLVFSSFQQALFVSLQDFSFVWHVHHYLCLKRIVKVRVLNDIRDYWLHHFFYTFYTAFSSDFVLIAVSSFLKQHKTYWRDLCILFKLITIFHQK